MSRSKIVAFLAFASCASEEAPRVIAPVSVDASGVGPVTTDLGYSVTLTSARAALRDLQLTVAGEAHASLWRTIGAHLVRPAFAHPGHLAGGEVTGELPGPLLIDFLKDRSTLGNATLIVGRYRGANFFFRRAKAEELPAGDALAGHTFVIDGTASKDGRHVAFSAIVDVDENTGLVGAPFDLEVRAGATPALGLRFLPTDPTDAKDTVFDRIDFFALDGGALGAVAIRPGQEAHNVLRRALQVHDHYDVTHK